MCLVFKSEMLHRREHSAERIGNLSHGRYLPVEVLAVDIYRKGILLGLPTGIDLQINLPREELEFGALEPEILCCVHQLHETWDRKPVLVEEANVELLEARGGDLTNECFQVGVNTSEPDVVKVRKCDGCRDWRMCELPLCVTVGDTESKEDHERLQLGHERKPLEQSIWMEVGGWVVREKTECDKAHSRRE